MEAEPEFRVDLYRGTARFHDTFRVPYPAPPTPHEWTIERLNGFLYSTSVLSKIALGSHAPAFEQDLRDRLLQVAPDNVLCESIGFHYTLARLL